MHPLDAPLTPDGDTARSWVEEELSRAEYSKDLSPVTRAIRWVLQTVVDALGGHHSDTPVAVLLLIAFAVFLVVLGVVVVLNPVGLRGRDTSSAIFDGEDHSLEDSLQAARDAAHRGAWDEAVVWQFRVLVLGLARAGLLRDAPGLTAREAATQAGARMGERAQDLAWSAALFDAVRYGTAHAGRDDHARLCALVDAVGTAAAPAARSSA